MILKLRFLELKQLKRLGIKLLGESMKNEFIFYSAIVAILRNLGAVLITVTIFRDHEINNWWSLTGLLFICTFSTRGTSS